MRSSRVGRLRLGLIIVACLPPVAMAGCSSKESRTVGHKESLLTVAENGGLVTLAADEVLALKLDARTASGYSWEVEQIDESIVKVAEHGHEGSGDLGSTDTQVVRFVGVAAGQTTVRLGYRRPWETDQAAIATYAFQVVVAGAYTGVLPLSSPPDPLLAAGEPLLGALPGHYNICESIGCTPIKDQGQCGGCWAFATAGLFEQRILAVDANTRDLAEQYLVSCNSNGWSCAKGGNAAFDYYVSKYISGETAAGAVYEADFPYTAQDVACTGQPHTHHEKIVSWKRLVSGTSLPTVAAVKQAINDYGGVWAAVCADSTFDRYKSGIVSSTTCTSTNHAVVLTGWDDNGGDGTTGGYWYMRNSWGSRWGESGNMRIGWGVNNIGQMGAYIQYGTSPSGGSGGVGTGGAATGGKATGGTATGGKATGGAATGGKATGGALGNTGGTTTTGGTSANTGGTATGGTATGGAATGGSDTGGTAGAGGATPGQDCLANWRNTPAGATCTGQTQGDRLTCIQYLDCYYTNNCGPRSCGGNDGTCGVNTIGGGTAGQPIADQVYTDLCLSDGTGGAANSGGAPGTGGSRTGGVPATTGGLSSTGGTPTGGVRTGGVPATTGGLSNTGGTATGGRATGGVPTSSGGTPAMTGGFATMTGGFPAATGGVTGAGGTLVGGTSTMTGGTTATGGSGGTPPNPEQNCNCRAATNDSSGRTSGRLALIGLGVLGLWSRRRR
jgi:MYXO-CTERM domain-containing protein